VSEETQTCAAATDCPFSDETALEKIAELAAEKAIEKLTTHKAIEKLTNHVYQEVGRSVISKFVYIVGACSLGLYLWLKSKGVI